MPLVVVPEDGLRAGMDHNGLHRGRADIHPNHEIIIGTPKGVPYVRDAHRAVSLTP
jgi:hypothetical protein